MSDVREFKLTKEFIELNKLLKYENVISSGAEAGAVISEGYVLVNGEVETRKRKKLRKGDVILFESVTITVF
ncbi:MAG TPA: RNA-binding protein [Flavobacteriales bacterium]|nr:RNA-binding protein [Flavobacteriales bacterium]|tara:strand:- start:9717 stop:9932 length:216 start_codon:yes stop_codon:yes gene_type:complete